ncbi:MAG: GNAT family N-acetyltransferase [Myxococcota bacterium]
MKAKERAKPPAKSSTRVRPARLEDWPTLCGLLHEVEELHSRIWPSFFRNHGAPAWSPERLRDAIAASDESVQIAEEDGLVVGLVHATAFDTPEQPALVRTRRVHVDDLVVAPRARRRGVGRRLLRAAEDWGRQSGATQCVLTVWEGNDAAVRFYAAMSYRDLNRVLIREI